MPKFRVRFTTSMDLCAFLKTGWRRRTGEATLYDVDSLYVTELLQKQQKQHGRATCTNSSESLKPPGAPPYKIDQNSCLLKSPKNHLYTVPCQEAQIFFILCRNLLSLSPKVRIVCWYLCRTAWYRCKLIFEYLWGSAHTKSRQARGKKQSSSLISYYAHNSQLKNTPGVSNWTFS
jgi:hypothetical protein